MNALAVSERKYWSFSSKKAFRPSRIRDWWMCIPDPFSPWSGFGMKVACQPYFIAYSLTVIR